MKKSLFCIMKKAFLNKEKGFLQGKRTTIKPSLIKLQEIHYPNLHVSF